MYAYCRNNPVCRVDIKGTYDKTAFDQNNPDIDDETPENDSIGGGSNAISQGPTVMSATVGSSGTGASKLFTGLGTDAWLNQQFKQFAKQVDQMITGTGSVAGTLKHSLFRQLVDSLGFSNIKTEISYLKGNTVTYGTKGSVRFDVILYSGGVPIYAWDYKSGKAILSSSRMNHMIQVSELPIVIGEINGR